MTDVFDAWIATPDQESGIGMDGGGEEG